MSNKYKSKAVSSHLRAIIVSLGSELLQGKPNQDFSYLSNQLFRLGIPLAAFLTLPDQESLIRGGLNWALRRGDIVIVTGGLGPTFDDLTRKVVSRITGYPLVFSERVYQRIILYFRRRNYPVPPLARSQAYVFRTGKILDNQMGTAPGFFLPYRNKVLILLPGPPREMTPLWENSVVPLLRKKFRWSPLFIFQARIFGLPESVVEERLSQSDFLRSPFREGLTILAHSGIVDLVSIRAELNQGMSVAALRDWRKRVEQLFADSVFTWDSQSLEEVVGNELLYRKKTVAVAESCTGGMLGEYLTRVVGSSRYFYGGVIAYANELKTRFLGVKKKTLEKYGAVSASVAREMAEYIRRQTGADYGLALTGISGPSGGSKTKPVGLVFAGISSRRKTKVDEWHFSGDRQMIREYAVHSVLDLLRRFLKT